MVGKHGLLPEAEIYNSIKRQSMKIYTMKRKFFYIEKYFNGQILPLYCIERAYRKSFPRKPKIHGL